MADQTFLKGGLLVKKIILIGTALLLVVPLLSACGVPQEDLDDAIAERDAAQAQVTSLQSDLAAAESALAAAESDLAAAESAKDSAESAKASAESAKAAAESAKAAAESAKAAAESDLAAAEAEVADLEAQIADLEAQIAAAEEEEEAADEEEEEAAEEEEEEAAEEEEEEAAGGGECVVEPSFAATEYVNADPAFSIMHPDSWSEEAGIAAFDLMVDNGEVYRAGIGAYGLPQVGVFVIPVADAPTMEDAIIFATGDVDMEIDSSADGTTADVTATTEALVYWIIGSFPVDSYMSVVQTGDNWIIVSAQTVTMYFPIDEATAWEIVRTLCLQ